MRSRFRLALPTDLIGQERSKRAFLRKMKDAYEALINKSTGVAVGLLDQANEAFPGQLRKAKQFWKDSALANYDIKTFLRLCDPSGAKQEKFLEKLYKVSSGTRPAVATWISIKLDLDKSFVERSRVDTRQTMLSTGLPPEIADKFLPKPFMVNVAPDGTIIKEFSIFGNKKKTIERKSRDMARILDRWNELMDQLNDDLVSSDPKLRLTALISSIILNTGIRPGMGGKSRQKENGKVIRDDEGKPIYVKTYGATGLLMEHIRFVRDDFAQLEFPGKAGTNNIADLNDKHLVQALKLQVEEASRLSPDPQGPAFVTTDGSKVTPGMINRYLKDLLGKSVSATDFRKLKATEVFYDSLKESRFDLAAELRLLKKEAEDDMKGKIVDAIVRRINDAVDAAATALNHKEVVVTIESYISPRVVLTYLSDAGLDKALSDVVGDGKGLRVWFDFREFFQTLTGQSLQTAAVRVFAGSMFSPGEDFVDVSIDELIDELLPSEIDLTEDL